MNMAAWHLKQMARTELSTAEYLVHYNALEDINFHQRVMDAEYDQRQLQKKKETEHG